MADDTHAPEQSTDQPAAPTTPEKPARIEPLVLRSWPKIILMLPTIVVSLICGILMAVWGTPTPSPDQFTFENGVGLFFLVVLAINLIILLYDLNLRGFLIVALLIIALVLGLFLLDKGGDESVWKKIGNALSVRVVANGAFYFMFAIILLFNLVIAWVITRFYYWRVEHNEIIIHRGFMHEQERHPTAQARFTLVIEDIVEYGLLGCGKLVFYFGDDESDHELTTILFVHRKAKRLDQLLGRVAVVHK